MIRFGTDVLITHTLENDMAFRQIGYPADELILIAYPRPEDDIDLVSELAYRIADHQIPAFGFHRTVVSVIESETVYSTCRPRISIDFLHRHLGRLRVGMNQPSGTQKRSSEIPYHDAHNIGQL